MDSSEQMVYCPEGCDNWARLASSGIDLGGLAYCPGCGTPLQRREEQIEANVDEALEQILGPTTLPDGFSMPDRIGEVIGWRAWRVISLGKLLRLSSVTHGAHWPTHDWVYAECDKSGGSRLGHLHSAKDSTLRSCKYSDDGKTPGENCTCGLYSAKDPEQLDELGYNARYSGGMTVVGQVANAGKIREGDQGWRSEKARVYKLYVPWDREIGQALAKQYRVPVELRPVADLSDLYES